MSFDQMPLKMNGAEPAVYQGELNGFTLTWNPDDNRYYVQAGEITRASFAGDKRGWSNAKQYALTHNAGN